jgi:hypothetical protein
MTFASSVQCKEEAISFLSPIEEEEVKVFVARDELLECCGAEGH